MADAADATDAADAFVAIRPPDRAAELSVVMPVFGQAAFVTDALSSILAQRDVVAEIIVSDDASTDATWTRVLDAARRYAGPHGIVVRRGTRRLRRDHLALLLERASCDVVVIAHGDDLAAPLRAATMKAVLEASGAAVAGSTFLTMGATGGPDVLAGLASDEGSAAWHEVPADELTTFHPEFTGAVLAVRRSALARFPRLDAAHAACGHDWVLPFRGGLAGGAVVIDRPLVARRLHDGNWSKGIWDVRRPETVAFGQALFGTSVLRPMAADVDVALAHGLVTPETAARLHARLAETRDAQVDDALDAHDALVRIGRSALWVTDDEAALAARGDLLGRYARVARVRDALQAARRAVARRSTRY